MVGSYGDEQSKFARLNGRRVFTTPQTLFEWVHIGQDCPKYSIAIPEGQTPLKTQLIIADGLSGSGKSTFCQWLDLQLRANKQQAHWIFEADVPHPLHWWNYWDGNTYRAPDFDQSTPAQFITTSVAKWKDFAAAIRASDTVYIVESSFFLLGIGMLLQADATPEELIEYGRQVQAIVQDLDPFLIYFRQRDVAVHVRKICDIRGKELEDDLTTNMERTPYFRRRDLRGIEGIVRLWSETQQITDALVPEYSIRKLTLETSGGDWEAYRQQVRSALSLPESQQIDGLGDFARLTGGYTYVDGDIVRRCDVVLEDGHLTIRTSEPQLLGLIFAGPSRELLPIDAQQFYAGITPVVITFIEDADGAIEGMRVDFTRLGGGTVRIWTRERL
jgi:hypothetical protein